MMSCESDPQALFTDVEDTPAFRNRVLELDHAAQSLADRVARLRKGAAQYSQSVAAMSQAHLRFAEELESFCTDDDNEMIAGPVGSFVGVLKGMAANADLLKEQIQALLGKRLDSDWSSGLLQSMRKAEAAWKESILEHDSVCKRKALLKNPTAPEMELFYTALQEAKANDNRARTEFARQLNHIEGRKRFEFLELFCSVLEAIRSKKLHDCDMMESVEPLIAQALEMTEQLRGQHEQRAAALEATITLHLQADELSEEGSTVAVAMRTAAAASVNGGSSSGLLPSLADGTASSAGGADGKAAEAGGTPGVLKQGWLLKKSHRSWAGDWQRRFFVLDSHGQLVYFRSRDGERAQEEVPTVDLKLATIKPDGCGPGPSPPHCFRIIDNNSRTFTLQAENEADLRQWMERLTRVKEALIHDALPLYAAGLASPGVSMQNNAWPSGGGSGAADSGSDSTRGGSPPSGVMPITAPGDPRRGSARRLALDTWASGADWQSAPLPDLEAAGSNCCDPGDDSTQQPPGSAAGPSDIILQMRGNDECGECGAPAPQWASINLGVTLCIECAGVHRKLGVHVSKVRSLQLDMKAWEDSLIQMFCQLGNRRINAVWERLIQDKSSQFHAHQSMVWQDSDSEGEDEDALGGRASEKLLSSSPTVQIKNYFHRLEPLSSQSQRPALGRPSGGPPQLRRVSSTASMEDAATSFSGGGHSRSRTMEDLSSVRFVDEAAEPLPEKPMPSSSMYERETFIVAKYCDRRFLLPRSRVREALWDAAAGGSVEAAMAAVAGGADPRHLYSHASAVELEAEADRRCREEAVSSICASVSRSTTLTQPLSSVPSFNQSEASGGGGEDAAAQPFSPSSTGGDSPSGSSRPLSRSQSAALRPRDPARASVLHVVCSNGHPACIEYLLQNGADIGARDGFGRTPLHYAIVWRQNEVAKLLLRRGAEAAAKDNRNRTPGQLLIEVVGGTTDLELLEQVMVYP